MFTLNIAAETVEELKLKVLGFLSAFKGISFVDGGVVRDSSGIDGSGVKANIETTTEEIKPVLTQEKMEELKATAPEHELPPVPTLEEVRAALKGLRDRKGSAAVKSLLKEYGADSLPDLKEEDYLVVRDRAIAEV